MTEKIIILDFGSQYTQLIARNIRELNVYCEIIPFHHAIDFDHTVKGVILSGSPSSVNEPNAPHVDVKSINTQVPVLGICYGAQLTTKQYGGKVEKSSSREYGRAQLCNISHNYALTDGIEEHNQVWMSHADTITELAPEADIIAQTDNIPVAAFAMKHTPFPL
ncbi:MAG TPA: gamma-glutamyl-gamma-aminobutyrate hydrolase family protein, partial [Chitinophagaceae bacterium]|nr:gamma-glutamyl-gamma-aminobutyrate hydrolase family protein [Chitinophagaceae bacterium]